MEKKKRLAFQLDTPYSAVSWPQISQQDQDTILELLCSLLSPIGHHRAQHIPPSKGIRAKKRKRKEAAKGEGESPIPPVPELQRYVDVGLSSITRSLQKASSETANPQEAASPKDNPPSPSYSLIFVARSGQPNALSNHLPQMVAVASKKDPTQQPTRLVGFSKACEDRLVASLGLPRVSCVGLRVNAPNSQPLIEFARQQVPMIQVPWLEEAKRAEHRETKISILEATIGDRKRPKFEALQPTSLVSRGQ
ncbi:hypothetical protein GGR57DRAFT_139986 [Xylariaceae sp. FL1272]|nr:hypothetical protein GGR57DRAFT_139986 [Xylariaceae sp. FL1272]